MINNFLAVILIVSTLLFGSVEVWSSSLILALIFFWGLIWVIQRGYVRASIPGHTRTLFVISGIFCLYLVLYIIPLPASVIGLISPHTALLRDFYRIDPQQSIPMSFAPHKTVDEILRILAFFIIFFISSILFSDRKVLKKMLMILMIFGFLLGVFAIVQKAAWNGKIYWFRELTAGGTPIGPFVNRNHFAGFMGMIVPLGLGFTLTREQKEKKMLFGFLTVIMAVSLFFSLSRGGIISFVAGMAVFSLLFLLTRVEQKKVWAIAFFLIVVAIYLLYLGVDPIVDRFYQTDISKEDRLIVWSSALTAWKDFWVVGTGPGTFIDILPLYSPPGLQGIYDHAHNDYIEMMLETGIVGSACIISFGAVLAFAVITSGFHGKRGIFKIAVISSITTMLVHSLFDFNLHILSNMLLFAVVLGIVSSLTVSTEGPYSLHRKRNINEGAGRKASAQLDKDGDREEWEEIPANISS